MQKTFLEAKRQFDSKYSSLREIKAFIPVSLKLSEKYKIKNRNGEKSEEYYKWQFFYSLIHSGLYKKNYLGAEIHFPKGNKSSAPIQLDGAIFNDVNWFDWYKKYHKSKDQESLDWLRKHLIGVIEFKKKNSKSVELIYNQQLKPAIKESESDFCIGILYDTERLYLFQKKGSLYLRLDEEFNIKGEKSTTKDLSLHLTDSYRKIPTFEQIKRKITTGSIDRAERTIDDLDIINNIHSKQLTDGVSHILRAMDKVGMKNQRGYEILIQVMALKIFDEKRSQKTKQHLQFFKNVQETKKLNLLFYITQEEKQAVTLGDSQIQSFIKRLRKLYQEASAKYHYILKRTDSETINWQNKSYIRIISEIVEQFQDYSFVNSKTTDLYQIVFYKFANEFSKTDKGQFITPIHLIDFLVKIVNPRSDEKIIDPTAGIGDFLSISYVNSKSQLDDNHIYGLDNDEHMIMLAQLNMLLNGDGNAVLQYKPDKGSIIWKFDDRDKLVKLDPELHKSGNWDNWKDETKLKKFDVVLTNPPFGEDRKWKPQTSQEKKEAEMYKLWDIARSGNWIDLGVIFLENAYHILKENGRMGIVISNSIASIDRWNKAREWLMSNMRIVALFDLPPNVFADTGVNTTLLIAYKPNKKQLLKLQNENYNIFIKSIHKVGYEVRTSRRVKYFNPIYKIDETNFEIQLDEEGNSVIKEEFSETVDEFKDWCLGQEKVLQDLFVKEK